MDDFTESYINKGVFFGLALKLDGKVILTIAFCNAFAVDALDEHPLAAALHGFKILGFVFQRDLPHDFTAFGFHFFWHLVGHHGGFCSGAHRVFEGVDVAEADFAGEVATFFEGYLGFAREAHDDISGEVEVGAESLDALAHVAELGDGIMPIHSFQCVVGAALQADVHVRG